ncbi:TfoX/Sxy family protein [Caenimonas terrae]|uniref:TfoX/Sxy family protein n=1 Tax=Caenimonas terrae TaxID=696074 RepID=A0ABW0NNA2_9BURK
MPPSTFARHCCELLASAGPCEIRPMFGGWGISTGGYNIALVADRGSGERLWLKADGAIRSYYEVAGCERFTYMAKGVQRSVNYYSAPAEAMESPELMGPWARQALECALKAQSAKEGRTSRPSALQPRPAKAASSRPAALAPSATARRKSSAG